MANTNGTTMTKTEPQNESPRSVRTVTPPVDIYETDGELVLKADLPGVKADGLDLRFEDGELLLRGSVGAFRNGEALAREFEAADFYRAFRLHESIDSTKIEAEFKNGILTVHLPKEAKHQPRQVAVKAS